MITGEMLEVTWRRILPKFYVFTDQDQCFHNGVGLYDIHELGQLCLVERNINHQKYIDVLKSSLLSSITNMFGDVNHSFLFQYNNASCHRLKAVDARSDEDDIWRMLWFVQIQMVICLKTYG